MPQTKTLYRQEDPKAKEKGIERAQEEERELLSQLEKEERQGQQQAQSQNMKKEIKELRTKFNKYRFGEAVHPKTFERLDVRDMAYVRIGVFGPFGGGKTSLIGTMERALFGPCYVRTAIPQGFGTDGTLVMEEYLSQLGFHLVDTRGLFQIEKEERDEILKILNGKIQPGDVIQREGDQASRGQAAAVDRDDVEFHKRIHAIIFVFKSNDVRFLNGDYNEQIGIINKHFSYEGYTPVTVVSGEDLIGPDEDLGGIKTKACQATGSPVDFTFTITNYTSKEQESDIVQDHKALNIIKRVVVAAEKYVQIQKQRESYRRGDSDDVGTVADFLANLEVKHKLNKSRLQSVQLALQEQGVGALPDLKTYWESLKESIPCSIVMKKVISEEVKKIP